MKKIKSIIGYVASCPLSVAGIAVFILAFLGFVIINLVLVLVMPLGEVTIIADVFNKSALGFGALLAGLGSLIYLETYIEKDKIKMRKKMYEKLYPKEEFGENKRFSVIQKEGRKGRLYIYDRQKGSRRHIGNYWETYVTLGWDMHKTITLKNEAFDKLSEEEEPIIISRRVGA
jgi:hypothetical protein